MQREENTVKKIRSYFTTPAFNMLDIEMSSREIEESDSGDKMSPTLKAEF